MRRNEKGMTLFFVGFIFKWCQIEVEQLTHWLLFPFVYYNYYKIIHEILRVNQLSLLSVKQSCSED